MAVWCGGGVVWDVVGRSGVGELGVGGGGEGERERERERVFGVCVCVCVCVCSGRGREQYLLSVNGSVSDRLH